MITPKDYQTDSAYKLSGIINDFKGAVLHSDEGTGKTLTACMVCEISSFKKILWVCPAKVILNTRKKINDYKEIGLESDIELISYDKFANPNFSLFKYDFIIFDECQHLINWNAKYTQRFVRIRKKFLAMSATPVFKSVLDFAYVIRKTGAFGSMSMDQFKIKFFGAVPSQFGNRLETGDFQNKEEFFTHANRAMVSLTQAQAGFTAKAHMDIVTLEGTYEIPEDITQSTRCKVECGLNKAEQAADYIHNYMEATHSNALILCHFHETAELVNKRLMKFGIKATLALTKESVAKAFENEDYYIITTLGLTSSGFDANYMNHVFMVESTYSYLQDRQSIRRCLRLGKESDISVEYFALKNEIPLMQSLNRKYLEDFQINDKEEHSKFGPSSLAILEKCPGSYWLPNYQSFEYAYAAFKGTKAHEGMETYIENPDLPVPHIVREECGGLIQYARDIQRRGGMSACETKVAAPSVRDDFHGTVDFCVTMMIALKVMTVIDYKSGRRGVKGSPTIFNYLHMPL